MDNFDEPFDYEYGDIIADKVQLSDTMYYLRRIHFIFMMLLPAVYFGQVLFHHFEELEGLRRHHIIGGFAGPLVFALCNLFDFLSPRKKLLLLDEDSVLRTSDGNEVNLRGDVNAYRSFFWNYEKLARAKELSAMQVLVLPIGVVFAAYFFLCQSLSMLAYSVLKRKKFMLFNAVVVFSRDDDKVVLFDMQRLLEAPETKGVLEKALGTPIEKLEKRIFGVPKARVEA